MLPIHLAPIQGHTDVIYRTLHHALIGGIECYHTPFVRWEKEGIRNKDLRDINPEANATQPTRVQIIFRDREEFLRLTERVTAMGWKEIDLNMGCPFPLQTHAGRGSGLLTKPEVVEQIVKEIVSMTDINFSVKMRLGLENEDEGMRILEIIDTVNLHHITLHPRLGIQQYKGKADLDTFGRFYETATSPIIYNGDLTSPSQIAEIEHRFPKLMGVMIGRGLLQRPSLSIEYLSGEELPASERLAYLLKIHDGIFNYAQQNLQGESQILSRMQAFWEPHRETIDKKAFKQLTKCGTLRNYREALMKLK